MLEIGKIYCFYNKKMQYKITGLVLSQKQDEDEIGPNTRYKLLILEDMDPVSFKGFQTGEVRFLYDRINNLEIEEIQ